MGKAFFARTGGCGRRREAIASSSIGLADTDGWCLFLGCSGGGGLTVGVGAEGGVIVGAWARLFAWLGCSERVK